MGQIVCPRCGQPNTDTANACGYCGCFLRPYPLHNISPEAQNYPPQGQFMQNYAPQGQGYPPQGQPSYPLQRQPSYPPQGQGYPRGRGSYPPRPLPAAPVKREPAEKTVSDFFSLWKASGDARKAKAFEIVGLIFSILAILSSIPFWVFLFCIPTENYEIANHMAPLFIPCAILVGFSGCINNIFNQTASCLRVLNCSDWMRREHIKPDIFAPMLAKTIVYHYYRPEKRGVRIFLTVLQILLGCVGDICVSVLAPMLMTVALYAHELQQAGAFNGSLFDIALGVFGNFSTVVTVVLVGVVIIGLIITFVDLGVVSSYIRKKKRAAENAAQKNFSTY